MTTPSVDFRPQPAALSILDRVDQEWSQVSDFSNWTSAVVGSGSVSKAPRKAQAASGATAASTAYVRSTADQALSRGKNANVLNWSKKLVAHLIISMVAGTTNGISRLTIGKATGTGVGALALKGIGFQVENLALKGLAHNGTTLATVDLATTLTANQAEHLVVKSDGAGRIEWFLNGVSKGSSAGGPTGDSAGDENMLYIESENGADAANQSARMHNVKLWVEQ